MMELDEQLFYTEKMKVHFMPTKTYKTNTFILQARAPLKATDASKRALLAEVLQDGTVSKPDRIAFRSALEELYGTATAVDVYKKGEHHIISFRLDVPNEKFLKDAPPLTESAVSLFSEMIFAPKREANDDLNHAAVDEEKRALKQKIASIYDDKMRYANKRLIEEMCATEDFSTHVYGSLESVEETDVSSLTAYYDQWLENDQLDLYVSGDMTFDEVKGLCDLFFNSERIQGEQVPAIPKNSGVPNTVREITEEQDIQQGKLHIGFRTGITYGDDDYFALLMMNGILGGFSHSKLFINVREKESLAYYAASQLENIKGLMIVVAGIQSDMVEKTKTIIFEQLESIRAGEISEEEMAQTRSVLKNRWLETLDSQRGRIELAYNNEFTDSPKALDTWFTELDHVSKADIIRVAEKIKLDTVYFLKGKVEE
ncbi:EF-P 5-aminopentanol modification-associated protein YfmF [Salisediminibacterium selenitireducens]|uniref:Peptidase M16 domain protein n=1 Tax=Bacillus selenitireducens (strain ATCC 700615 / DSM 15326 / MLS10) TaxID=439292 RepID=D6XU24_BACIE|nr:pitrilysin family protein [Salisediminibacterium selenitireducens]ADH99310.1 peptidase M16 domain protein [[Bacillus] selenitireducens MLS10]